jgi:hypothetical protein
VTDVEISRALNAVSTTLRDQRPDAFDATRVEQIATGALGGERKLIARKASETSGELRTRNDEQLVAVITLEEGQWTVERRVGAGESSWAIPQPAHDQQEAQAG